MKELKDLSTFVPVSVEILWNPVKELKERMNIQVEDAIRLVESGEGIERA